MAMTMTTEQIIENKKLEDHCKKNKKYLKEHGWTVYYGWDKYCPYAEHIYEDCGGRTGWERARAFPWQDHTRRLKKKDEEGNVKQIPVFPGDIPKEAKGLSTERKTREKSKGKKKDK